MQERGSAPQIADDEQRLFDGLGLMTGEKNVIEKKAQPVDKRSNGPDHIEHQEKDDAPACETSGGILSGEEGAVGGSREEMEIVGHDSWVILTWLA